MAVEFTVERFFSLRDEYEKLCKASDKGPDGFTRLESLEDQVLSCAKYLAENESNIEAMVWLCDQRLYGSCRTDLNPDQFVSYLTAAVEKNHLQATRLLAKHYYGWDKIISPAQIDREKAMALFEKAAETDDRESRYDLALVLLEEENDKADAERAKSLLKKLMDEFYPPAFFSYFAKFYMMSGSLKDVPVEGFSCLHQGMEALDKGQHECAEWFRERLTYYTALCYAEGLGCDKDIEKAIHLMKRSAEITAYGDAYFWLKNKGLERLIEPAPIGQDSGAPESGIENKPAIFAAGAYGESAAKPSDLDSPEFYETRIDLEKPLTFINFGDTKGREAAKRAAEIRPDLTKADLEDILKPFDSLVGLENVKEQVRALFYMVLADSRRRAQGIISGYRPSLHMVFAGNPGTGKTTVARLVGEILKKLGYLKRGHVVEVDRSKLIGEYIGQSEQITAEILKRARDGVLFVDEAYDLEVPDSYRDYGHHIITMIVKAMEDQRNNMVVIFAGFKNEMKWFIESNAGLRSRISAFIDFPDYTDEELVDIFAIYCKNLSYSLSGEAKEKIKGVLKAMEPGRKDKFGNARGMRNLFDETVIKQARRVVEQDVTDKDELVRILPEDVPGTYTPGSTDGKIAYLSTRR
ncbi:MAG: AAA family ATPase [Alphaproteobacteria bacterium]|nr:AAA family ATPase [Alphaproteobacteria bacterium]MCB1839091.1 AAA family ATPase [Alphaproteobacteria bacterium]